MRINVDYGGGADAVFFDVTRREAISYEMAVRNDIPEDEFFHSRFGGKLFYRSRTGLSGAGWYDSSQASQLVQFGWYRPDYIHGQQRQQVAVTSDNYTLYGYLPIKPHEGIDRTMPAVLVQAGVPFIDIPPIVAFVSADHIDQAIRDWGKITDEAEPVQVQYYACTSKLEPREFEVRFWNRNRFHGVNLVRFLGDDLARLQANGDLTPEWRSRIDKVFRLAEYLHIYQIGSQWGHWNVFGFCDHAWSQDPREMVGPLPEGWYAHGDGIFVRRHPRPDSLQVEVLFSPLQGEEDYRLVSVWELNEYMATLRQQTNVPASCG